MGKATVTNIVAGSRQVEVEIGIETNRLDAAKIAIDKTVITLNDKVTDLENEVISDTSALDAAKFDLETAIANESPRQTIIRLQEQVIVAMSNLVDSKTRLNITKFQLAGAIQQQTKVNDELGRDRIRLITTADSGTSIQIEDIIGIAEYARQSDPGSFYVALPSERASKPADWYLYDEERDGIALPQLSEQPYGWWYNTMVVPSAQIFQPRYVLGQLLNKDDDANTGTVYIYASADFKTRPVRPTKAITINVPFDYETTDSLSFISGDLVLLEYQNLSVDETPTIIGFGTDEVLSTTAIAYHKDIVGLSGSTYMTYTMALISDSAGEGLSPDALVSSSPSTLTHAENGPKVFAWGKPIMDEAAAPSRFYVPESESYSQQANNHHGFDIGASGVDASLVSFATETHQLFTTTEGRIANVSTRVNVDYARLPPATPGTLTYWAQGGGNRVTDITQPQILSKLQRFFALIRREIVKRRKRRDSFSNCKAVDKFQP